MKPLLAICLSLSLSGCAGLPDQPDGWSCLFFYDSGNPAHSSFMCNRIKHPEVSQEFNLDDPTMGGAHCMDIKTFKAYSDYVFKLREDLINCKSGE
jgi:hypothetical protein